MVSRLTSIGIVAGLVISAFAFTLPAGFVCAAPDTHTWDGGAWPDHKASTAANWNADTLPEAGDSIVFDGTNTSACTWDLALAMAAFSINAGYTGTVTQGASFSVTSFTQAAGTVTGSVSYILTCSGNFAKTAGAITDDTLKVTMTGAGSSFANNAANHFLTVKFSADATVTATVYIHNVVVDAGITLTIASSKSLLWPASGYTISNSGIIAGPGTFYPYLTTADVTANIGVVNAPMILENLNSGSTGSRTFTFSASTVLGSSLSIVSSHATNTMTLDLSASNYALTAAGITIGTRGILNGRGSIITDSDKWDSQNGTFTKGTSSVHLTGASKNIWMSAGTTGFQNLFMDGSYTLRTNAKTYNYWKNGSLTNGAFTLTINNDQAPSFTSTPSSLTFASGSAYSYNAVATDREGETRTYGLTTNLSGLSINTGTGAVSRGTTIHARGTFTMHVSVTDGNASHTVWQNSTLTLTNVAPVFVTSPILESRYSESYSYDANATDTEGATLTYGLSSDLYGLVINSTTGVVSKTHPVQNGTFHVSISVSDGNYTTWQNYTLIISPLSAATNTLVLLGLTLLFGFGLMVIGLKRREFWIMAGPIWIVSALTVFEPYGILFLFTGIGIGIVLLYEGVMSNA